MRIGAAAGRLGAALLALALVAACGSSGFVLFFKSADQLVSDALDNLGKAPVVQLSGSFRSPDGKIYDLDVEERQNGDLVGSVRADGHRVQVISLGSATYLNGGADYWTAYGTAQDARVYAGHWLKVSSSTVTAALTAVARLSTLRDRLSSRRSDLQKGSTGSIDGVDAIALDDSTGTIHVTADSPYRFVRVTLKPGRTSGGISGLRLDFKYPSSLAISTPAAFYDPADPKTLPALYQVEGTVDLKPQPNCQADICSASVAIRNTRGKPVGTQTATFTASSDKGAAIGNCSLQIPPVDFDQTETLSCNLVGLPGWGAFVAAGGGSFTVKVTLVNPPYDAPPGQQSG